MTEIVESLNENLMYDQSTYWWRSWKILNYLLRNYIDVNSYCTGILIVPIHHNFGKSMLNYR